MLVKKKSSLFRRINLWLIAFLLTAGVVYSLFEYSFFDIKNVTVEGGEWIIDDILFSSPLGKNIFLWRAEINQANINEFSDIKVKKDFWSRDIKILLTEREKYIIWCFEADSKCFWVDDTGFIFSPSPSSSGFLVNKVLDGREASVDIGDYVMESKMFDGVKDITNFIEFLSLRKNEFRLNDFELKELRVDTNNGPTILFSLLIDPIFSADTIKSLMGSAEWEKISTINLTVDGRIYYD